MDSGDVIVFAAGFDCCAGFWTRFGEFVCGIFSKQDDVDEAVVDESVPPFAPSMASFSVVLSIECRITSDGIPDDSGISVCDSDTFCEEVFLFG